MAISVFPCAKRSTPKSTQQNNGKKTSTPEQHQQLAKIFAKIFHFSVCAKSALRIFPLQQQGYYKVNFDVENLHCSSNCGLALNSEIESL